MPQEILIHDEERGCRVTYAPGFLATSEANALFGFFLADAPFVAEKPVVFGKVHKVTRATCAFGDAGVRYRYAGVTREAAPWLDVLSEARSRVERAVGAGFNFVLCTLYPDGKAGLGWHADDERDLCPGAPIASLSLGETRDFHVRRRDGRELAARVSLEHGSLLVMSGATQRFYQHQVPKRARCRAPRVNLTFRAMHAQG